MCVGGKLQEQPKLVNDFRERERRRELKRGGGCAAGGDGLGVEGGRSPKFAVRFCSGAEVRRPGGREGRRRGAGKELPAGRARRGAARGSPGQRLRVRGARSGARCSRPGRAAPPGLRSSSLASGAARSGGKSWPRASPRHDSRGGWGRRIKVGSKGGRRGTAGGT